MNFFLAWLGLRWPCIWCRCRRHRPRRGAVRSSLVVFHRCSTWCSACSTCCRSRRWMAGASWSACCRERAGHASGRGWSGLGILIVLLVVFLLPPCCGQMRHPVRPAVGDALDPIAALGAARPVFCAGRPCRGATMAGRLARADSAAAAAGRVRGPARPAARPRAGAESRPGAHLHPRPGRAISGGHRGRAPRPPGTGRRLAGDGGLARLAEIPPAAAGRHRGRGRGEQPPATWPPACATCRRCAPPPPGWPRRPQLGQDVFARGAPEDFTEIDRSRLAARPARAAARLSGRPAPCRRRAAPTARPAARSLDGAGRAAPGCRACSAACRDWTQPGSLPAATWPARWSAGGAVASTLLAGLEMARGGALRLRQEAAFRPDPGAPRRAATRSAA